jgi:hypothetical protein
MYKISGNKIEPLIWTFTNTSNKGKLSTKHPT